jgi:hypothetical protein
MPAHLLRSILQGEVEFLLPDNTLATAKAAEESEQAGFIRSAAMKERGELT